MPEFFQIWPANTNTYYDMVQFYSPTFPSEPFTAVSS